MTTDTYNVRVIKPAGGSSYFYFEGVTADRAVELSRMYTAAQCVPVAYYEVRSDDGRSLLEPPLMTAPAFA